jgi:glucose-6-phosphate 1-dehydrogenase
MKVPGAGFNVQQANMDFRYSQLSDVHLPSSYERLIHDCMIGDASLFTRGDAVEAAWEFVSPILDAWKNNPAIKLYGYPAGSWGPSSVDQLIDGNAQWRYPCKNLADDGLYCEL